MDSDIFDERGHDIVRDVQFTVLPGRVPVLQQLPGFTDFNPFTDVLKMLRSRFGLEDAARLWSKVLAELLV